MTPRSSQKCKVLAEGNGSVWIVCMSASVGMSRSTLRVSMSPPRSTAASIVERFYWVDMHSTIIKTKYVQPSFSNKRYATIYFWMLYWNIFLEIDDLIMSKMGPVQDFNGHRFWQCHDCDYKKPSKADVFKHVERRHVELQVSCTLCSTVCGSRQELKAHIKSKHKNQF